MFKEFHKKVKFNEQRSSVSDLPWAYAVTIHESQGLSLDCTIIDLSSQMFGEGMAYVALSRVRSLSGVHLTAFSSTSIMASRTCVEEVNRLRHKYKLDLPTYDLPAKKSRKRKVTGTVDHVPPKNLRVEETVLKGVKWTSKQTHLPNTLRMVYLNPNMLVNQKKTLSN